MSEYGIEPVLVTFALGLLALVIYGILRFWRRHG